MGVIDKRDLLCLFFELAPCRWVLCVCAQRWDVDGSHQPSQGTEFSVKLSSALGITKTFISMPIPSLTLSFPAAEVPHFSKDPTTHEAGQVFRGGEIMQPLLGKLPAPLTTQLENVANFIHWGVLGGLIGFSGHNVLYIGWVEGD